MRGTKLRTRTWKSVRKLDHIDKNYFSIEDMKINVIPVHKRLIWAFLNVKPVYHNFLSYYSVLQTSRKFKSEKHFDDISKNHMCKIKIYHICAKVSSETGVMKKSVHRLRKKGNISHGPLNSVIRCISAHKIQFILDRKLRRSI